MGLLGNDWGDPRTMATLQLAAGLLGGGNIGQALGRGLNEYQGSMTAAQAMQQREREMALREEEQRQMKAMRELQMAAAVSQQAEAERQRRADEQFRSTILSPLGQANAQAAQAGPLGSNAAAQAQPPVDPFQMQLFKAMSAGVIKPMDYLSLTKKDTTPIKLSEGEQLLQPGTFKPLASNPKQPTPTAEIQQYQFAVGQGYTGSLQQFINEQKRAGAPSVGVKIDNTMGGGIASQVGPMLKDSFGSAVAAQQQIASTDNLIKLADAGNAYVGPGASLRLKGAQIAKALHVGGASDDEKISNTRQIIQALAQQTLSARGQLKGQGQVSDYEGKLIQQAASGDVDSMTIPEIKAIAQVNSRLARQVVSGHNQFVEKIRKNKNSEIADLASMFDLPVISTNTVDFGSLPNGR